MNNALRANAAIAKHTRKPSKMSVMPASADGWAQRTHANCPVNDH